MTEGKALTLGEFADWLDQHRPSPVQLQISPDYNKGMIAGLEWAAAEARRLQDVRYQDRQD